MARVFARPARAPSVTLERIRPAARVASSTIGSRRIAMNVWWMQRLSNIELVLGDTTAGTRSIGKRAQKGVREHSTLSSEIQNSCPGIQRGTSERLPEVDLKEDPRCGSGGRLPGPTAPTGWRRAPGAGRDQRIGAETEVVSLTFFDDLDAVRGFAGPDYEPAVAAGEARQVLIRFDEQIGDYETAVQA
jgi:hypothetical protein